MSGVFISYRRDDSAGFAGALERELVTHLGRDHVFIDVKDIEAGTEFPVVIDEAIKSSDVVLVLIGPGWLDTRDSQGLRRIEKQDDFVRREVALALAGSARVIPVLLDGARLPTADQLPGELQLLTARHALELRNSHWDEDFVQLLNHVQEGMYTLDLKGTVDKKVGRDFDPSTPSSTIVNWISYGVLGIGLVFVMVGLVMGIVRERFLSHAVTANARVVGLLPEATDQGGYVYRPQVEYATPSGRTASTTFDVATDPPAYRVGDIVTVQFDPADPTTAVTNTFWGRWLFVVIFGGVGLVICFGGTIPFFWRAKRRRGVRRLMQQGRPILTSYRGVEQNRLIEVNGRHPFYVITQWRNPVSYDLVQFRSPALWDDPTMKASGRMITVVVDPDNLHRYVMDMSFLYRVTGPIAHRL